MTKQPTIKDVASKAGVSVSTVSFVLNDVSGQRIGKAVQDRIRKAAQLLNYHPNASAVNLARHRTRHVAIALYEEETLLSNSFYSRVVEGALKQALERTSIADRVKGYCEALRRLGLLHGRRQLAWKSPSLTFEGGFAAAIEGRAQRAIEETVDAKLIVRGSTGNKPVRKSKAA